MTRLRTAQYFQDLQARHGNFESRSTQVGGFNGDSSGVIPLANDIGSSIDASLLAMMRPGREALWPSG